MNINIYLAIISAIIGYLIGSISFARIIVSKIKGEDISSVGSGNAGTTNVFRAVGFFPAFITFILDLLKGSVSVLIPFLIGKLFKEQSFAIYMIIGGIFSIIGHTFPVYFKFKGGKGVATYLGIILAINPLVFLINLIFMFIIIVITGIVSIASITSSILIPILILFLKSKSIIPSENLIFFTAILFTSLIIIFMHRGNIKRLKEGKENKINLFKRGKNEN